MTDYTITTNFGAKDSLPSGNAGKVIKGSEFTTEFTNIQTAVNTKADTAGDTFTGAVNFSADVAVNTNTLFVDVSTANVGIGTASPQAPLHVHGDINLGNSAGADAADVEIASLNFYNRDTSGSAPNNASIIRAYSHSATGSGAYLTFATSFGGESEGADATEKMRIDSSGNVGIGTTSPDQKGHISGAGTQYLRVENTTNGVVTDFGTTSTGSAIINRSAHPVSFFTNAEERMRIDALGNVGIGTDSPDALLHVNGGDVKISSDLDTSNGDGKPAILFAETIGDEVNAAIVYNGDGVDGGNNYIGIGCFDHGLATEDTLAEQKLATTFNVRRDGKVGIGTTSPSVKLHIDNGATSNLITQVFGGSSIYSGVGVDGTGAILTAGSSGSANASMIFRTASNGTETERMRIDSSGDLMVGTTDENALNGGFSVKTGTVPYINVGHASSVASGNYYAAFRHGTNTIGTIAQNGTTSVLYNTSSDERLKENITDSVDAGSKVDAIQIRQYDWKADGSHQDYGVIAQELVTVAPEAVHQPVDEEDMMGVDYSKLVPMLIKEVQSLRSRVAELENV